MSATKKSNNLAGLEHRNDFKPENTYYTASGNKTIETKNVEKTKKKTKSKYTSMRLKPQARMEIEAYKFATGLKFDNDAAVRLLDFWKANAKISQRQKFDRYLNMLEEESMEE